MLKEIFQILKFKLVELKRGGTPRPISFGSIRRCIYGATEADFFVTIPNDVIQRSHVCGKFYEEEELDIIKENFRGGTFVDIGSNIGNHSVFMGKQENCRNIVAFEPNPAAYRNFIINVAINELSEKTTLWKCGLSDKNSEHVISVERGNLGGATMRSSAKLPPEFNEISKARVMTGDAALHDVDVSFVKIDVEGFEYKCLLGLRETIARCRPNIFVEVSDENEEDIGAFFKSMDYRIINTFKRYAGMRNVMAVPSSGVSGVPTLPDSTRSDHFPS